MKFDRYISQLVDFAMRNTQRGNTYTVVSGVIKGNSLTSMAVNSNIKMHAEPQALKKHQRGGNHCKKGRSARHQS